jgi:hypothetical protein
LHRIQCRGLRAVVRRIAPCCCAGSDPARGLNVNVGICQLSANRAAPGRQLLGAGDAQWPCIVGQAPEGKAMIRRIDIDVLSTATTISRTPGFITGQAWSQGHAWGTFSGGSGQFSGSSSGCAGIRNVSNWRVQHRPTAMFGGFFGRSLPAHPAPDRRCCYDPSNLTAKHCLLRHSGPRFP